MLAIEKTDVGMKRKNNEDDCAVISFDLASKERGSRFGLALVCDGMGGAAAGEVASATAIEVITHGVTAGVLGWSDSAPKIGETIQMIRDRIIEANDTILKKAAASPEMEGMGTTCVLSLVRAGVVFVANVGDSRGYRWRDGKLSAVTRDHSYIQELIDAGVITEEQSRTHSRRNEITRALGIWDTVEADVEAHAARAGDVYMLCSDGLWEMVNDERITKILSLPNPPGTALARLDYWAQILINEANDAGGVDNISVVLVEIEASDVVEGVESLLQPPKPTTVAYHARPERVPGENLVRTLRYSRTEEEENGNRGLAMPAK